MRIVWICLLTLVSLSLQAGEANPAEPDPTLENRLSSVEFRTQELISGKEDMLKGLAGLQPRLRNLSCSAYPVGTVREALARLRIEILELEGTSSRLNADQLARLATQKKIVASSSRRSIAPRFEREQPAESHD